MEYDSSIQYQMGLMAGTLARNEIDTLFQDPVRYREVFSHFFDLFRTTPGNIQRTTGEEIEAIIVNAFESRVHPVDLAKDCFIFNTQIKNNTEN